MGINNEFLEKGYVVPPKEGELEVIKDQSEVLNKKDKLVFHVLIWVFGSVFIMYQSLLLIKFVTIDKFVNKEISNQSRAEEIKKDPVIIDGMVSTIKIHIDQCAAKGSELVVFGRIVNQGPDITINIFGETFLNAHSTKIEDDFGERMIASEIKIGSEEGQKELKIKLKSGIEEAFEIFFTKSNFSKENLKSEKVKLLELNGSIIGKNSSKNFSLEFKNIRLVK